MADRVHTDSWDEETENLDSVLTHYLSGRLFLPITLRAFPTVGSAGIHDRRTLRFGRIQRSEHGNHN
jgi:hypothetical protein